MSTKNWLLIAVAMDANHGSVEGVKALAKQAPDAGASKKEIFEALEVAHHISGAGSIYTAARAQSEVF